MVDSHHPKLDIWVTLPFLTRHAEPIPCLLLCFLRSRSYKIYDINEHVCDHINLLRMRLLGSMVETEGLPGTSVPGLCMPLASSVLYYVRHTSSIRYCLDMWLQLHYKWCYKSLLINLLLIAILPLKRIFYYRLY